MNPLNCKFLMLYDGTLDNTSASIAAIDTIINGVQFTRATFLVFVGVTDIALTTLKVQEGDVSGTLTDIAATVFGGGSLPALPTATDDNTPYQITVNNKKRWLKPVITAADGTVGVAVIVIGILSEPRAADLSTALAIARGMTGKEVVA